jgi:hypothetical protein
MARLRRASRASFGAGVMCSHSVCSRSARANGSTPSSDARGDRRVSLRRVRRWAARAPSIECAERIRPSLWR